MVQAPNGSDSFASGGGDTSMRSAVGGSGGSTISPTYGNRIMKAYPITEGELSEIGTFRGLAATFFSLGSFCFGLPATTSWEALISGKLSKFGDVPAVSWILFSVAFLAFILGFALWHKSGGVMKRIRKETTF